MMNENKPRPNAAPEIAPRVTALLGCTPVLPGESQEEYRLGLQAVIQELEAKTVLQVYLAEKMFECLWWMRRYEQQKRATLAREMAAILCSEASFLLTADEAKVMESILDPARRDDFNSYLARSVYSEQTLWQEALSRKHLALSGMTEQITIMAKNLAGFQTSYEVLTNRKLVTARLRLQNDQLARDLNAIEMDVTTDAGQPQKTRRKSA
jgi:hypothetical protein